jgi:hypothetical protein
MGSSAEPQTKTTSRQFKEKHMQKLKALGLIVVAVIAAVTLTACEDNGTKSDEAATNKQLEQYQKVQPIPFYEWSQYRETITSIADAQAKGTATTSFFFTQGVQKPIKVCPSIGYPVPSTAQLTSPDQAIGANGATIGQMEPTGVYTGESTGTYVVCIIQGKAVPTYWEGFVHTEGSPAEWDEESQQIVNTGAPTVVAESN